MRPVTVLETRCPTHVNKFLKFAGFKFYSRIVVNKLSGIEKVHFRKWETYSTKNSKCKADIQFILFHISKYVCILNLKLILRLAPKCELADQDMAC